MKSAHADKKKEKIHQAKSCQEKLVSFSLQKQFQTILLNLWRNDGSKIPWKNSWGSSTYALLTFHMPLIANETSIRNHEKYGNHLHSAKPFQVNCPDTESIHSTRLTHSRSLRGEVIEIAFGRSSFLLVLLARILCRSLFSKDLGYNSGIMIDDNLGM